MIDLWYLNVKNISQEYVNTLLKYLPLDISNEINRFKNDKDRRLKFFGKLIVKKFLEDKDVKFEWSEWHTADNGKPYYREGSKFNISHSGDYVMVAFSDQEIGIDVERITEFDVTSVIHNFHPKEIEHINMSEDSNSVFFKIWTRKEAYLKATGNGIINGLDNENCLSYRLGEGKMLYLRSLSLFSDYQVALCTSIPDCKINIRELALSEFGDNLIK